MNENQDEVGRSNRIESSPGAAAIDDRAVDILLVDDRVENLLALEVILEPLGQRLVRARSGDDALRRLLERDFALILLDVRMPGMDGFTTARLIKSRERSKLVPIIFITADDAAESIFDAYGVGAVDHIRKPFSPTMLRSKVSVFVELALRQRRILAQEQRIREIERHEAERRHSLELLQSEERLSEVVQTAMDAIFTFDASGRIYLVNTAAESMFATTAADVLGSPITRFFPDGVTPETVAAVCEAAGHLAPARPPVTTARRSNGELFPIEATASSHSWKDGRGPTFTLFVRDISEQVAREQALRQQARSLARSAEELSLLNEELHRRQFELERAMSARTRFYASMSHELRTPINAVLGYSTLLLEQIYGPLNDRQLEGVERTQRAARHLLELVNDVLDLSKIEAGKIDLRLQAVDLPALIEDLFVTVRPFADQHGSALNVISLAECPPRVISDPGRLRQILLNLLSNAIKFGRGEPIEVTCSATSDGGAIVAVRDRGEGIAPEDQTRIFQEFVQLGKTQLGGGTGLGLPISKRLAELLRGSLTVESEPGSGSTFYLRLPRSAELHIDYRLPDPESVHEASTEHDAIA